MKLTAEKIYRLSLFKYMSYIMCERLYDQQIQIKGILWQKVKIQKKQLKKHQQKR